MLAAIEDAPEPDEVLRITEAAVSLWPDERRTVPIESWRALQDGSPPPPWLPLARHLRLERGDRLDGLDRATSLTSLDLTDYDGALTPLGEAPQLRNLALSRIDDPELFAQLPKLESLTLRAPPWLPPLEDLPLSSTLRMLAIRHADDLVTLRGLERWPSLQRFELDDDRALSDIDAVAALPALTQLMLVRCAAVTDLSAVSKLVQVERLTLNTLNGVTALPPLDALVELREFVLAGAWLSDLSPVSALRSLRRLQLSNAPDIGDLTPLGALESLQTLFLSRLPRIVDVSPVAGMNQLESLGLAHLDRLSDLEPLSPLRALKMLTLQSLPALRSLAFLSTWTALEHATIAYCGGIDDVDALARVLSLRVVTLRELSLQDISSLAALPRLEQLAIAQKPPPAGLDAFDSHRTRVYSPDRP